MIKLGDTVKFCPSAFTNHVDGRAVLAFCCVPEQVSGVVTYINIEHRYFRVGYKANELTLYECFKF